MFHCDYDHIKFHIKQMSRPTSTRRICKTLTNQTTFFFSWWIQSRAKTLTPSTSTLENPLMVCTMMHSLSLAEPKSKQDCLPLTHLIFFLYSHLFFHLLFLNFGHFFSYHVLSDMYQRHMVVSMSMANKTSAIGICKIFR